MITEEPQPAMAWSPNGSSSPITICLLGEFRLLVNGHLQTLRPGGKSETLLAYLALEGGRPIARAKLVTLLRPDADPALASHTLSNVAGTIHTLLAPVL